MSIEFVYLFSDSPCDKENKIREKYSDYERVGPLQIAGITDEKTFQTGNEKFNYNEVIEEMEKQINNAIEQGKSIIIEVDILKWKKDYRLDDSGKKHPYNIGDPANFFDFGDKDLVRTLKGPIEEIAKKNDIGTKVDYAYRTSQDTSACVLKPAPKPEIHQSLSSQKSPQHNL